MGNLCCSMLDPDTTNGEPSGNDIDVPAKSNLPVAMGMDGMHDDEDLGMQESEEKRGRY